MGDWVNACPTEVKQAGVIGEEGSRRQTNPECIIRSLCEVETCLHKTKRRNFFSEEEFGKLQEFS